MCTFARLKVWTRYGSHQQVYQTFKDLMQLEPVTDLNDSVDTETVTYSVPDALTALNCIHALATRLSEYNWEMQWSDLPPLRRGQA